MWIAALIIFALVLLLQLRIRLLFIYREGGPLLYAGLGPFMPQVYPIKSGKEARGLRSLSRQVGKFFGGLRSKSARSEKKRRKQAEKKAKGDQKEKLEARTVGDNIDLLRALLPTVLESVRRLRRKLLIKELTVHLNWGARDPADAAIGYGRAHAVMGAILPVLEASFRVKKRDTLINLDYELEKPNVYLRANVSMSLMQAAALGIFASRKVIGAYMEQRKQKRKEEKTTRKAVQ